MDTSVLYKQVVGYEGSYDVTASGYVFSYARGGRVLKPFPNASGYLRVGLWCKGVVENVFVHKLVAEAFVGGYFEGAEIHHIDEDKLNNNYVNLQYVTHAQNMKYSREKITRGVVRARAKYYTVTTPCGVVVVVCNMMEFCRDNNLHPSRMYGLSSGVISYYKGFTVEEFKND